LKYKGFQQNRIKIVLRGKSKKWGGIGWDGNVLEGDEWYLYRYRPFCWWDITSFGRETAVRKNMNVKSKKQRVRQDIGEQSLIN
jgi:hypothetical protein